MNMDTRSSLTLVTEVTVSALLMQQIWDVCIDYQAAAALLILPGRIKKYIIIYMTSISQRIS
mgnify:CR=1 FL=1